MYINKNKKTVFDSPEAAIEEVRKDIVSAFVSEHADKWYSHSWYMVLNYIKKSLTSEVILALAEELKAVQATKICECNQNNNEKANS